MEPFARALELAARAAGGVSPRPPVGAVVVDASGEIVGEGATQPRPGPHAEVVALEQAGESARGGTLYSTLEPHQFYSEAPPCTEWVIKSDIKRVVCPVTDPHERVNGKGFQALAAAGIEVSQEVPHSQAYRARKLIEPFAKLMRTGLPFVTLKWGMSLDGCVATRTGDSKWISSQEWLQHAHELRYESDAVLTGIGTVLSDDPLMTARDLNSGARRNGRPRLRVVVDSSGRLSHDAAMLRESGDIIHVVGLPAAASPARCERLVLPYDQGDGATPRVDVARLMSILGKRGVANILVDAGPTLSGELLRLRLIDRIVASISTRIVIGGTDAMRPIGGVGPALLTDAPRLTDVATAILGDDIMVEGSVDYQC